MDWFRRQSFQAGHVFTEEALARSSFFRSLKGSFNKGSLGKLLTYTGPALIVSMAYMDPGNYGTAIQGGASYGYTLLWIVWLSSGMAMLLQYLSGKLGIATEKSLPELIRTKLNSRGDSLSLTGLLPKPQPLRRT